MDLAPPMCSGEANLWLSSPDLVAFHQQNCRELVGVASWGIGWQLIEPPTTKGSESLIQVAAGFIAAFLSLLIILI
jgi:hypothetical protein